MTILGGPPPAIYFASSTTLLLISGGASAAASAAAAGYGHAAFVTPIPSGRSIAREQRSRSCQEPLHLANDNSNGFGEGTIAPPAPATDIDGVSTAAIDPETGGGGGGGGGPGRGALFGLALLAAAASAVGLHPDGSAAAAADFGGIGEVGVGGCGEDSSAAAVVRLVDGPAGGAVVGGRRIGGATSAFSSSSGADSVVDCACGRPTDAVGANFGVKSDDVVYEGAIRVDWSAKGAVIFVADESAVVPSEKIEDMTPGIGAIPLVADDEFAPSEAVTVVVDEPAKDTATVVADVGVASLEAITDSTPDNGAVLPSSEAIAVVDEPAIDTATVVADVGVTSPAAITDIAPDNGAVLPSVTGNEVTPSEAVEADEPIIDALPSVRDDNVGEESGTELRDKDGKNLVVGEIGARTGVAADEFEEAKKVDVVEQDGAAQPAPTPTPAQQQTTSFKRFDYQTAADELFADDDNIPKHNVVGGGKAANKAADDDSKPDPLLEGLSFKLFDTRKKASDVLEGRR